MATEKNCLKLKSPGTAETSVELPKVGQTYYGIEFTKNVSNNGGDNGYHKMIGTDEMLKELPVHNQCRAAAVIDAKATQVLNPVNIFKDVDGNDVDLAGASGEDFMFALPTDKPVYAILGGTHETYERWLFGNEPFSYGGDIAQLITPFAESLDHSTQVDSKQRCIYDPSVSGSMGTQNACITEGFEQYKSSGGFPKNSTTRFNYELYARNKNEDNTQNVPYCNCNSLDLSFFLGLLYVECRTKWLTKVFGDGISSNTTPSASNWDGNRVSGVRITEPDGTVHYYTLGSTALYIDDGTSNSNVATFAAGEEPLYVTREGNESKGEDGDGDVQALALVNGTRIWDLIEGGAYPVLQILEAQRDISNGCVEGTFESVTCPDGTAIQGLDDGVMTGVWVRTQKGKIQCAFSSDGDVQECDIEVKLCEPIYRNNTWKAGDIWWYRSGSECLLYVDADGNRYNYLYQAKTIENMAVDTDTSSKDNAEDWAFVSERGYELLGDMGSTGGWCGGETFTNRAGVTHPTVSKKSSGAKETFEGAYNYFDTSTTTAEKYIRRYVVFGGGASSGSAVVRDSRSNNAPSSSLPYLGSGFRCKLTVV